MRLSCSFFLPVLLSLFLVACGGGGGEMAATKPAATLAEGLSWVDVQDGSGNTVMQHRYAAGATANEEWVTTTQYAGYDGVWGTADDWRTAVTRCRYQGDAPTSPLGFGPSLFLGVAPSLCATRHALAGTVQAWISGGALPDSLLDHFRPETATADDVRFNGEQGWQPYLNTGDFIPILAGLNGGVPVAEDYSMQASVVGMRLCRGNCVATGTEASLPVACNSTCWIAPSPLSDGLIITLDPYFCGATMVAVYDGVRAQVLSSAGRPDKVIYSPALDNPVCYVSSYDRYRYDDAGRLVGTETYDNAGSDGIWLNDDDGRSTYLRQEWLDDGYLQVLYSGAGEDGVWESVDDAIGSTQRIEFGADGRLARATQCTDPGADLAWQTADDACRVMIFHYGDD